MTEQERNQFEKVQGKMAGLYKEVGILSKKKPDEPVNKFKLGFINQILSDANSILKEEYKPLQGFELFDEDELPTNSDVTMICELYLSCLEKFRSDNIEGYLGTWYWVIDGNRSEIRTSAPKKLRN